MDRMTSSGDSTDLDERNRRNAEAGRQAPRALDPSRPEPREPALPGGRAAGAEDLSGSPDDAAKRPSAPQRSPRRWVRPAMFLLLPILLIAGAWVYVTGGQVT